MIWDLFAVLLRWFYSVLLLHSSETALVVSNLMWCHIPLNRVIAFLINSRKQLVHYKFWDRHTKKLMNGFWRESNFCSLWAMPVQREEAPCVPDCKAQKLPWILVGTCTVISSSNISPLKCWFGDQSKSNCLGFLFSCRWRDWGPQGDGAVCEDSWVCGT